MTPPTTGRLGWTDLPRLLRDNLTGALGAPVTDVVTPKGGFGHQLAAALTADNGSRAFVKAAPDGDPLSASNLHEAHVLAALPAGAPAPSLLGIHRAAGWTAVVIEHLDGPHPDLSPGSTDPGHIWALLDKLTGEPAPTAYAAAVTTGRPSTTARLHGWAQLAADPPADLPSAARARLPRLAELEASWPDLAHGTRIVHGDLRADNMVRDADRGVTFVDWAHATTGPACIDAVSLAPQLVLAGADPADVARALDEHPAATAEPRAATAFLAALTGHWHRNARLPEPPGAPGLRDYQHRAASAGLALLLHRLP
ncbi:MULTISPECIES: phosphotransferase family protein [unclassified Streptomyces]|uniref:phosphotransferase family protein n=1 Tax=unclassified Streptomyces TaxID=2593676 RepID=UPI002E28C2D1|nr:phosphotransferase [Streptomyces sp. NBC_00223]